MQIRIHVFTHASTHVNTHCLLQALKQRNEDAISAADDARNKMAMEAGAVENLRPPSPKIEREPCSRLEPYRLFVVKRDGSGYEIIHKRVAETQIRLAKEVYRFLFIQIFILGFFIQSFIQILRDRIMYLAQTFYIIDSCSDFLL